MVVVVQQLLFLHLHLHLHLHLLHLLSHESDCIAELFLDLFQILWYLNYVLLLLFEYRQKYLFHLHNLLDLLQIYHHQVKNYLKNLHHNPPVLDLRQLKNYHPNHQCFQW